MCRGGHSPQGAVDLARPGAEPGRPVSREQGIEQGGVGGPADGGDSARRPAVEDVPALHPRDGTVGARDGRRRGGGGGGAPLQQAAQGVQASRLAVGREVHAEEGVLHGRLAHVAQTCRQMRQIVREQTRNFRTAELAQTVGYVSLATFKAGSSRTEGFGRGLPMGNFSVLAIARP